MAQSKGRNAYKKTDWTKYAAWCAVIVSATGIVYGLLCAFLPLDSAFRSSMGLTGSFSAEAWMRIGLVMVLQSVFGLVAGLFGLHAVHTNYPPDGKPFFIFALIGLMFSLAGMFPLGFTSFVAIIVDGVCTYQAWQFMKRPIPKRKRRG